MAQLKEGQRAPKFRLHDKDGKAHELEAAGAAFTVLYFYPKDSTPGCTLEAQEFSAALKDFKARGARVIGVSGGDEKSKAKFCSKYKLSVPLVSDTDFRVARSFGAFGDKKFMGRSFKGIFRKTFLLDRNGVVVRIFESVKPEGHADEVLAVIDSISRTTKRPRPAARKASGKKSAGASSPKSRPSKARASRPARKAVARKK